MKKKINFNLYFLAIVVLLLSPFSLYSCDNKKQSPPVDLSKIDSSKEVRIPFTEKGGIKTIPVKLNGLEVEMVYDSGCSGMQLSSLEIASLYKNGKFTEGDVRGAALSQIADGSVVQNVVINIREVEIGGSNGFVLKNVEATMAENPEAPVMIGNSVFDKVASVEIDNIRKCIVFKRY